MGDGADEATEVGTVEREEEEEFEPDEEDVPVVEAKEARSTDERERECRVVFSGARAREEGAMNDIGRRRRGGGMSSASASLLSFDRRMRGGRAGASRSAVESALDEDERGRNDERDVLDCARW